MLGEIQRLDVAIRTSENEVRQRTRLERRVATDSQLEVQHQELEAFLLLRLAICGPLRAIDCFTGGAGGFG